MAVLVCGHKCMLEVMRVMSGRRMGKEEKEMHVRLESSLGRWLCASGQPLSRADREQQGFRVPGHAGQGRLR